MNAQIAPVDESLFNLTDMDVTELSELENNGAAAEAETIPPSANELENDASAAVDDASIMIQKSFFSTLVEDGT